jgi:hemoglobin
MSNLAEPQFAAVTEDAIEVLIDGFYAKVRRDPVLGPIFEAAIAPGRWPQHIATMRRFWSSVMLASGRYSGDPVAVHRALPALEPPLFARWLTLFQQTAHDLFAPAPAALFVDKAQRIAASLERALSARPDTPSAGLPLSAKPDALAGVSGS